MGTNKIKLCGSNTPILNDQLSFNGLHVKFCSDNKYSAKGIYLLAHKHDDVPVSAAVLPLDHKKREIIEVSYAHNYTTGIICLLASYMFTEQADVNDYIIANYKLCHQLANCFLSIATRG